MASLFRNRQYASSHSSYKNITLSIVAITIVLFIVQKTVTGFSDLFILDASVLLTQPWRLITHIFMHADISHLLFNMYGLFLFGTLLERRIGSNLFLLIYFTGGIGAGIIASFFYPLALGASAALFAVIGTLIILMPDLQLLFFFFIPTPLWVAGIIWALIDVFGVFYPSGVGNIAHLAGLGLGLLFGYYLKNKKSPQQKHRKKPSHENGFVGNDDIEVYLRTGKI